MLTTVWALDDGYGDLKGYSGTGDMLIPSYYTRWRPRQSVGLSEEVNPYDHIGVEVDGKKYLIGKGAIVQDSKATWLGGENKHLDDGFPILLKASLAIMAGKSENVSIAPLVMGLPVKADMSEARHRLLKNIVVGHHQVKVELANGEKFRRSIYIKDLVTKQQPFGSFCDIILGKTGDLKNKDVASKFNVVIDIGARTLNVLTLDALEPITDLSDTTNHGMYTAYEWVSDYVEEELGFAIPSGKLPYIVQKGEIKGKDLHPAIIRSYQELVNEIRKVVDTMFVDSWAFVDNIILTGGGSEVLKPYLRKAFVGFNVGFLGRHNTARGLHKYGLRYNRKRNKSKSVG